MSALEWLGVAMALFSLIGTIVGCTARIVRHLVQLEAKVDHVVERSHEHEATIDKHDERLDAHDVELGQFRQQFGMQG